MATNNDIEKRLWAAADELRANSRLRPSEFSVPVLGLIFLRYADHKFPRPKRRWPGRRRAAGDDGSARRTTRPRASSTCPETARFSAS